MPLKVRKPTAKRQSGTYARLTPFLRGVIFGMFLAGSSVSEIMDEVTKPDGSTPSKTAVEDAIQRVQQTGALLSDGGSGGASSAGRPRSTEAALDKKIVKFVFKHRGLAKVTVAFLRKRLPAIRKLSTRTLQRRLQEAGLAWMKRRRKSLVPTQHKPARLRFARWVLRQSAAMLRAWAYSDGTTFYLARSASEHQDKARAALGTHVWRMASGSDALFEECVGPSRYAKAQGQAVRIWGLLINGILFVFVLPAGECMNRLGGHTKQLHPEHLESKPKARSSIPEVENTNSY